jgi:hypothetical protein
MWIPTLSLFLGAAAAQTPAARPAQPPRPVAAPLPPGPDDLDAPTPRPARPAIAPMAPRFDDQDAPTPRPAKVAAPRAPRFDDDDRPTPRPAIAAAPLPPDFDYQDLPTPKPAPVAVPRPVVTPFAAPLPPDFDDQMWDLQDRVEEMKSKFKFDKEFKFDQDFKIDIDPQAIKEMARDASEKAARDMAWASPKIAADIAQSMKGAFAFAPQQYARIGRNMSDDRLYSAGQAALDAHRYAEALEDFNQVAARGGSRADGAWYWKAYTLIKLGRRDEALAAIAELRKSYANSHWLDDAKALEVDAGKPVSPESESDEELKIIALNGLVQSDPDRAFPLLENLLKSAQSPSLKKKTVFVLAQSNSPKAQALLEQVARGGQGNPDLQLTAIRYLGERRNQPVKSQMLFDIYNGTADVNVKHAILNAFENSRDKDHLLQIAKTEKNDDLRMFAIRMLANMQGTQAEMWQLYQNEANPEAKRQILESIPTNGNLDKLVEIAKTEKDAKLRRFAIQNLSSSRASTTGDALAAMYATEQDQDVKRAIIDALYNQKSVKPMIAAARAEKDVQMKRRILERLVNMKSPEATDYLMEVLK